MKIIIDTDELKEFISQKRDKAENRETVAVLDEIEHKIFQLENVENFKRLTEKEAGK